jgi:hypothetical protein
MNAAATHGTPRPLPRGDTTRRGYRRRTQITTEPPELIPMTDQEREAGLTALSRLIAELLTDENFLVFAGQRTPDSKHATVANDRDKSLPL